ncbi:MFS transporter [Streptomyces sp. NPDC058001]|uniref:MFS transporter n=1 Tax=Streptomyces sp. NPDC058001 TaxID=3346300 RepID=UPI0036ECF433
MDTEKQPSEDPKEQGGWFSAGVGSVSAASFFSDSGHEIATAVMPSFLTSTLHASPGALGLVEGVSDALTGVAKLAGGPLANEPGRRARIATGGYLGTAAATGAIGLAMTVWQVGVLRALAWASRGIRSPARDSLLASLVPPRAYGRAFGLERTGDNLGAVVGPLLAALLVTLVGIRETLYFAALPGLLAAVAITIAGREARRTLAAPSARRRIRLNVKELRGAGMPRVLVPIAMFELGNVAVTLLILRATQLLHHGTRDLAAATSLAVLIYAAHNAFAAVMAYVGGHWIDRAGPRVTFATGGVLYVAAYGMFAVSWHGWLPLLAAFVLAGCGIGFVETAESTLVARMLPDELRGSGFGVLGLVQAGGALASSSVVGLLWTVLSPTVGFTYAAAWAAASAVTVLVLPGAAGRSRLRMHRRPRSG